MRLIKSFVSPDNGNGNASVPAYAARVYRDSEWDEYVVKYYVGQAHVLKADYHTNDKADAIGSAKLFVGVHDVVEA